MKMSDKTYDGMKYVAQIFLPAIGTLYFALAEIWGFPYAEELLGTITAVDTCLGTLLHLTKIKYSKECDKDA